MPNQPTTPPEYLFVYGSLMSGTKIPLGTAPRRTLRADAKLIGEGTIKAKLYNLGTYPGAVASSQPGDTVWGEVWQLIDAHRVLAVIDRYEGIAAATPEYRRAAVTVTLLGARDLTAWCYLYAHDVSRLSPVPDGRWPGQR